MTSQSKQQIKCLFRSTGWKDSQVYSLPVGQAVPSMYQPKSHFNKIEKIFLMIRVDYSSSVIIYLNFPKHFTFLSRKVEFTNLGPDLSFLLFKSFFSDNFFCYF